MSEDCQPNALAVATRSCEGVALPAAQDIGIARPDPIAVELDTPLTCAALSEVASLDCLTVAGPAPNPAPKLMAILASMVLAPA